MIVALSQSSSMLQIIKNNKKIKSEHFNIIIIFLTQLKITGRTNWKTKRRSSTRGRVRRKLLVFWRESLFHMSNDRQLWLSLFLKRKLSENLGTESWLSLFSKTDYHLTSWADFLQNFRSYSFQSAVFTNIILNSTTSNYIFRKMLNIEILEGFASANQFEHQNHQFPPLELIYARWLSHILWET